MIELVSYHLPTHFTVIILTCGTFHLFQKELNSFMNPFQHILKEMMLFLKSNHFIRNITHRLLNRFRSVMLFIKLFHFTPSLCPCMLNPFNNSMLLINISCYFSNLGSS